MVVGKYIHSDRISPVGHSLDTGENAKRNPPNYLSTTEQLSLISLKPISGLKWNNH